MYNQTMQLIDQLMENGFTRDQARKLIFEIDAEIDASILESEVNDYNLAIDEEE